MGMISTKPFSLPLILLFTTIFLMLLKRVNSSDALSFSYNEFELDEQNLIFQGDAHITSMPSFTGNVLQLTKTYSKGAPQRNTVGRVLFSTPFRLYIKGADRVSNFESNINIVLTKPSTRPADGLAFFIAPIGSTIPKHSNGGYLGLFDKTAASFDSTANPVVVAVEFDTYHNPWDPKYAHIGINVNSINSSAHVKWERKEGEVFNVRIAYNALFRNLSVVSHYSGGENYTLSYLVDLPSVLPEWVNVGITAASGRQVQVHSIISWSFNSGLETIA
ncbi:hypothetical protein Lal_00020809 [Lupinus albus]|uniref:Putative concanavalin A-like lectin/glucanase domain, legume lectin, beta chain, Mn/Ca-binding n=1 Tax=Lupinus albus TaxID=3870 RepID=A0A6A4Q573_LUPAL|nr:putative concanavalin A-like lectin/glucanase domain, legume lectin, beta chain, Mn/Ca-binding [Lupinus albus]KAF1871075.1 hypothetical protein Lal_00020809 [Lupinus albus]